MRNLTVDNTEKKYLMRNRRGQTHKSCEATPDVILCQ